MGGKSKNCLIIVLLIVGWLIQATNNARFRLGLGLRARNLCPVGNTTCDDGSNHFLCQKGSPVCPNVYKNIVLKSTDIKFFIQGHNGIRNKVAKDFGIANMNLLYWSRELQIMAKKYLFKCEIKKSGCHTIGKEELVVNMNYSFRERHLFAGWAGRIVRSWYIEIGNSKHDWPGFLHHYQKEPEKYENFTQMIWPTTEFVGCDAASIREGFFVVCFYYPASNPDALLDYPMSDKRDEVIMGAPCTQCDEGRSACSITFPGLCGVDNNLSGRATSITLNGLFYWILFVFLFVII